MFALGIIDKLGPEQLTGGRYVAGTGEIAPDGVVGPIGGIQQKVVAARRKGAEVFLVPAANCADAVANAPEGLQPGPGRDARRRAHRARGRPRAAASRCPARPERPSRRSLDSGHGARGPLRAPRDGAAAGRVRLDRPGRHGRSALAGAGHPARPRAARARRRARPRARRDGADRRGTGLRRRHRAPARRRPAARGRRARARGAVAAARGRRPAAGARVGRPGARPAGRRGAARPRRRPGAARRRRRARLPAPPRSPAGATRSGRCSAWDWCSPAPPGPARSASSRSPSACAARPACWCSPPWCCSRAAACSASWWRPSSPACSSWRSPPPG